MKKFTNYRDLYNHIIKSFYLGEYKKNDRFPTQVELVATYHVAANSIKKVFAMLRDDGFISTDRSFGTHVLFDRENPAHVAKVPLFHPDSRSNDPDTLIVPSRYIAYTVFHGLQVASPRQITAYLESIKGIIAALTQSPELLIPHHPVFLDICHDLNNSYINDFTDYLQYEYLFVDRTTTRSADLVREINQLSIDFYTDFKHSILDRQYNRIIPLICRFYQSLYRIPGLLVFATLDKSRKVFAQQPLYSQLVHKLFLSIVAGDMKKGDLLPTESEISSRYGVSLITVRKAASVLKETGLIDGERFVGTRMLEDWDSPVVQGALSHLIESQHKQISDAVFAEYILGRAICEYMSTNIPPTIINEIQHVLDLQWEDHNNYNAPLFVSDAFITPLVMSSDSALLHTCYFHVHDDLTKFLAVRLLQMSKGFEGATRVHIYAIRAVDALRQRDFKRFASDVDAATLLNWELLRSSLDNAIFSSLSRDVNL